MTSAKDHRRDELLADRALGGLADDETAELTALLADAEDDSFERAAAAVEIAFPQRAPEPLPPHLARWIETQALTNGGGRPLASGLVPRSAPKRDYIRFGGWLAAAACLALAMAAWMTRSTPDLRDADRSRRESTPSPTPAPLSPPSPTDVRERTLVARDALHVAWTGTRDPLAAGATGDVVWSTAEQRGAMRFHGLPANDPAKFQYQLWIFDPSQSDKTPIDGGVFDVDGEGEVTVPIQAKLRVTGPTLFAVTIEKPGGVVVSKREHIVLVAPVKA